MLGISFGLIATQVVTSIHVTKNLGVCHICHDSEKFIRKILGTEIILKDLNGFHHFQNGYCPCSDFEEV